MHRQNVKDKYTLNVLSKRYVSDRNIFSRLKRQVRYSIQRIKYGYCDMDLWNLDCFYATLFVNSLKQFNNNSVGYPCDMEPNEWYDYILETADCFENYLALSDAPDPKMIDHEEALKEAKRGCKMLGNKFGNLWD